MGSPLRLQITRVPGSIHLHTRVFSRTGSFPRWHAHPLWFFFLIGFFFLLALLFLGIVAATKSSASPSIQSSLLVPPGPLRDLFEERIPEKSFSGSGIFLLNLVGKPGFGVGRGETDKSLESTSGQRRRLVSRCQNHPVRIGGEEWKSVQYLLKVSFVIFVSQGRIEVHDQVSCTLGQRRWRPVLGVLDVLLNERNTQYFQLLLFPSSRRGQALRDANMKQGVKLFKGADFLRLVISVDLARARDVERLFRIVEYGSPFFDPRGEVAVHAENVICDHPVVLFVHVVRDNEEKIETGEKGIRKCNVLVRVFVNVVLK